MSTLPVWGGGSSVWNMSALLGVRLQPSSFTLLSLCCSGCLTQEKIVASCAKNFIIIADYRFVDL